MTTRNLYFLVVLLLIMKVFGVALLISFRSYIASFPEILMGQVVLARETKSISARSYLSAEFVLNHVALSEI